LAIFPGYDFVLTSIASQSPDPDGLIAVKAVLVKHLAGTKKNIGNIQRIFAAASDQMILWLLLLLLDN